MREGRDLCLHEVSGRGGGEQERGRRRSWTKDEVGEEGGGGGNGTSLTRAAEDGREFRRPRFGERCAALPASQ